MYKYLIYLIYIISQPCVMVLLDHGCEVEGRNEMNLSPIDISNQYMMESIGHISDYLIIHNSSFFLRKFIGILWSRGEGDQKKR